MGYRWVRLVSLTSLLVLALLIGTWVTTSKPARAACAAPPNYEVYVRDSADLIVTGTVEDVTVHPTSSTVEIGVEQVYKGAASGETLVVTTTSGSQRVSSVDVQFEEGARYLLYLQEKGGGYTTSICSGTQPVGDSIPPELAASFEEATSGVSTALPETGGPELLTLAVLVGLLVSGIGAVVRRWAR